MPDVHEGVSDPVERHLHFDVLCFDTDQPGAELVGEEVKTAPKGFNREDPNIDLIRKKAFIFVRKFADKEVLSKDFIDKVNNSFIDIRPYFDLMSEILTTNLNGESLLD